MIGIANLFVRCALKRFFEAYGGEDKTYKLMKGADHYYVDQPEELADAVDLIHDWLDERGFVD